MTSAAFDVLCFAGFIGVTWLVVEYGGALLDRINSLLSAPDPSELEGEP